MHAPLSFAASMALTACFAPIHYAEGNLLRRLRGNIFPSEAENDTHSPVALTRLPEYFEENLANVWDPYDRSRDVPYFWQIPKAGTTNALAYFSTCLDVVKATRVGSNFPQDMPQLEVMEFDGHKYMNVDTSTVEGMRRAKQLGLEKSHLVDIITSGFINDIPQELFTKQHRGRMFAILRHPIERLISIFYYLQKATWEPTYHPEFANWSLEDYVKSPFFEGNWMVRMITNKMHGEHVGPRDLQFAKDFLRTKCLVGLQSDMNNSLERFQSYFGWELKDSIRNGNFLPGEQCRQRFFHPDEKGGTKMNSNKHPDFLPGSPAYDALLAGASMDVELYNYAIQIYHEQEALYR